MDDEAARIPEAMDCTLAGGLGRDGEPTLTEHESTPNDGETPPSENFEASDADPGTLDEPAPACAPDSQAERDAEPAATLRAAPSDEVDAPEISPPQIIEALLFASDAPLSAGRLAELLGAGTAAQVRLHIDELNRKYADAGLSFRIEPIARGYQLLTQSAYRPWLQKLDKHRSRTRLSDAALEALAIVAYKQPIIRADVEAIRGVACGEVLNRLREMGMVRIFGRAEIVGRPMLYGTTRKFLDVFGLADLDDLPAMETLTLRRPSEVPEVSETPDSDEQSPGPRAVAGA